MARAQPRGPQGRAHGRAGAGAAAVPQRPHPPPPLPLRHRSWFIRHPAASWHDVPDLPKAACRVLDEKFAKFTTRRVGSWAHGLAPMQPQRVRSWGRGMHAVHGAAAVRWGCRSGACPPSHPGVGEWMSGGWVACTACARWSTSCAPPATARHTGGDPALVASARHRVVECQKSQDGETTKLLLELQDGLQVESVIMHYGARAGMRAGAACAWPSARARACLQAGAHHACAPAAPATRTTLASRTAPLRVQAGSLRTTLTALNRLRGRRAAHPQPPPLPPPLPHLTRLHRLRPPPPGLTQHCGAQRDGARGAPRCACPVRSAARWGARSAPQVRVRACGCCASW